MTNKTDDYKVGFYEALVGLDWNPKARMGTELSCYHEGRNHGAREREELNRPMRCTDPVNVAIDAAGAIQHAVTVTRPDPSRAEMAMHAMQGLLNNTEFASYAAAKLPNSKYADALAQASLNCADALIAALKKETCQ